MFRQPSQRIEIFERTENPDRNLADLLCFFSEDPDHDYWINFCRKISALDVVEFGCGCGNLAQPMARAGLSVVGVDCNPSAIRHLQSTAPANLLALVGNFESIRLDQQFDIAFLKSCVVNTINSKSRRLFFETSRAALRRGGALVVELYKPAWLTIRCKYGNKVQDFLFEPISPTTCRIKAEYYCGDVIYELNATAEIVNTDELTRLAVQSGFAGLRERITRNPLSHVLVYA